MPLQASFPNTNQLNPSIYKPPVFLNLIALCTRYPNLSKVTAGLLFSSGIPLPYSGFSLGYVMVWKKVSSYRSDVFLSVWQILCFPRFSFICEAKWLVRSKLLANQLEGRLQGSSSLQRWVFSSWFCSGNLFNLWCNPLFVRDYLGLIRAAY